MGKYKFESNLSSFEITFEIRKNSQFHQGNKVLVAATKDAFCPPKLFIKLKDMDVNNTPSSPIFCGLNGRLVAKNPQKRHKQEPIRSLRNCGNHLAENADSMRRGRQPGDVLNAVVMASFRVVESVQTLHGRFIGTPPRYAALIMAEVTRPRLRH